MNTGTDTTIVPSNSTLGQVPEALRALYPDRLALWSLRPGGITTDMVALLNKGGQTIVSPTKVGYIIMTVDAVGLEKKFAMKERPKKKPGVVLCSSLEQLEMLAEVSPKILKLYHACWDKGILLGCILPWKESSAKLYIPDDGSAEMVMDTRKTSCFVINYGAPSERISKLLWDEHRKLAFASSANPSGKGNRGKLEFVGENIINNADMLVFADDYVERQQPGKSIKARWEQGVMVSMVNAEGKLADPPMIIRHGLDLEKIKLELTTVYGVDGFIDNHGAYH